MTNAIRVLEPGSFLGSIEVISLVDANWLQMAPNGKLLKIWMATCPDLRSEPAAYRTLLSLSLEKIIQ